MTINNNLSTEYGSVEINEATVFEYILKKTNNIVCFNGYFEADGSNRVHSICILPEGFRPSEQINITIVDNDADLPSAGVVYNTGEMKLHATSRNTQSNTRWYFSVMFMI